MSKLLYADNNIRKWSAILLTLFLAGLLTVWEIYDIGEYGITLFLLIPIFIGALQVILYEYKNNGLAFNRLGLIRR